MAAEDMFTLFADVKQELGVLLVVLGIPKNVSCLLLSVSVNNNTIEVTLNRGEDVQRLCKFNINGISILPATCNRLQMSSDGSLHLRFQVKRETALHIRGSQCNGASKNSTSWSTQASDVVSVLSGESYAVLCRMCASPIVRNKKFQRVLPCPSDDWFEMSESWWCHRHDHSHDHGDHDHSHDHNHSDPDHSGLHHERSALRSHSNLEKSGDHSEDKKDTLINVALGNSHHDQIDSSITNDQDHAQTDTDQKETNDLSDTQNQDQKCDQILRCDHYLNDSFENRPCTSGSHVGKTDDANHDNNCKKSSGCESRLVMGVADCLVGDINLLFDETSLLPCSCLTADKARVQCARCRCFLGRFKNSDTVRQASSFLDGGQNCLELMLHMLVVTSDPSTVKWPYSSEMLEVELALYLQAEREAANSFRFIIEMRNEKNAVVPVIALWIVDVRTLLYTASSSASVEQERSVLPLPVIKLMYKDCLREQNQRTGHLWYRDLTVQSIELPESSCLTILQILIDSTKSLPQSLRLVDDFYVGFLRR